jgi:uncharacterized coiled-coil DUF342 family protein
MNYKKAKQAKELKNELKRLNATISDMKGMIAKRNEEIVELKNGIKRATIRSIKIEDELKELSKRVTIMDTNNAHNGKLVDGINDIFNDEEGSKSLVTILSVLYIRDAAEVEEKLNVKIVEVMEKPLAYASDYLMNVADDVDLECILDFCRYKC